jgi:hypothetical protein
MWVCLAELPLRALQSSPCVQCRTATAYLAEQPLRTLQNCQCVPYRAAPGYLAELPLRTLQSSPCIPCRTSTTYQAEQLVRTLQNCQCVPCKSPRLEECPPATQPHQEADLTNTGTLYSVQPCRALHSQYRAETY